MSVVLEIFSRLPSSLPVSYVTLSHLKGTDYVVRGAFNHRGVGGVAESLGGGGRDSIADDIAEPVDQIHGRPHNRENCGAKWWAESVEEFRRGDIIGCRWSWPFATYISTVERLLFALRVQDHDLILYRKLFSLDQTTKRIKGGKK